MKPPTLPQMLPPPPAGSVPPEAVAEFGRARRDTWTDVLQNVILLAVVSTLLWYGKITSDMWFVALTPAFGLSATAAFLDRFTKRRISRGIGTMAIALFSVPIVAKVVGAGLATRS